MTQQKMETEMPQQLWEHRQGSDLTMPPGIHPRQLPKASSSPLAPPRQRTTCLTSHPREKVFKRFFLLSQRSWHVGTPPPFATGAQGIKKDFVFCLGRYGRQLLSERQEEATRPAQVWTDSVRGALVAGCPPWGTHHAVGAVGAGAGGIRFPTVVLQHRVISVLLLPQQRLQALNVADGVAQDLHLGQALVGVGGSAALEGLKGLIDLAEPPPLPHGGSLTAVSIGGLPLASLAGPQQAAAGLVVPAGRPDVLLLVRVPMVVAVVMRVLLGLQQAPHVHQPGVQVLEEVHVRRVEARVIVEVISGCEGAEGALRHLHGAQ